MKKIISSLILLFMLTSGVNAQQTVILKGGVSLNVPNPAANDWWITTAGAGTKAGTSLANAGQMSTFNHSSIAARDTIHLCGPFKQNYTPTTLGNGLPGFPITITGTCPGGTTGAFDGANLISTTWTSVSSNVYSTPVTTGTGPYTISSGAYGVATGGIVTEDDVALIMIPFKTDAATTIAIMVSNTATYSKGTWSYDAVGGLLYVLTTDASNPTGHTMEVSYGQNFATQINLTNKSNIILQNLTIKNSGYQGIFISGGTNDVVQNNLVYNIDNWALFSQNATNLVTTGNTMHHTVWILHAPFPSLAVGENIRYNANVGGSIYNNDISSISIGIDLTAGTNLVSVYNNKIHDNIGNTTAFSNGIYSDNAQNNFIYGNQIYNYMVCLNLSSETSDTATTGTTVYNNLCYNWVYTGIYGGNDTVKNNIFFGNFYNANPNGWSKAHDNFIYNNTFLKGPDASVGGNQAMADLVASSETPGIGVWDYNHYYNTTFGGNNTSYAAWQSATSGEANGVNSSPAVTDVFVGTSVPPDTNLQLIGGSPAGGVGVNLSDVFNTDYGGNIRPSSGPWDVGAYGNI